MAEAGAKFLSQRPPVSAYIYPARPRTRLLQVLPETEPALLQSRLGRLTYWIGNRQRLRWNFPRGEAERRREEARKRVGFKGGGTAEEAPCRWSFISPPFGSDRGGNRRCPLFDLGRENSWGIPVSLQPSRCSSRAVWSDGDWVRWLVGGLFGFRLTRGDLDRCRVLCLCPRLLDDLSDVHFD